jgi:D-alanyl-lipoteichoic acid acyltransferase DltB (MBOAT superfamily)
MRRCFGSSTTIANFWRDWHASFNLWIVRYMYIPLGGSRAKVWAIAPIFTFVALWHDIELQLIRWAGVMCVAFVLEVMVGALVARSAWLHGMAASRRPLHVHAYRHLQAVGGALSTFSLIVANLYGFGTGDTGTTNGVGSLLTWAEAPTLVWCLWLLYVENLISNFSRDVDRTREQRRELRVLGPNGERASLLLPAAATGAGSSVSAAPAGAHLV